MSLGGSQTITNREERLSGVRIQSSTYGLPLGIYYGTQRITPNIIWYGDFRAIEHTATQSSGGKGGGSVDSVSISYTYQVALMLGLGEGIITPTHVMPNKDGWHSPAELGLEVFTGAVGQAVWGHLTSLHTSQALAYSGTAHLSASAYDLGNTDALPNFSILADCNTAITPGLGNYIQDFLTAARYGAGFPLSRLSGIDTLNSYLDSQGMAFTPFAVAQQEAAAYLREWTDAANTALVWSEGLLKFVPHTDSAGVAYNLGPDDFIVDGSSLPVRATRKRQADATNTQQVEYLDADHEYNIAVAEAQDQANIDQYGLRPAQMIKCHQAKSATVARWVAQHRMQRALYVRNQFRFRLGWKHARLEPMDVVTLTEPRMGLAAEPALILEITESEWGDLEVLAEEYNGIVSGAASYTSPTPAGPVVNRGVAPGNCNTPLIFQPPVSLSGQPELWLATSGGDHWGGCEVWASLDDATYQRIAVITTSARHGTLRASLASGSNPDTSHTLAAHIHKGELLPGTTADATDLVTLCYVDGELLAYRDATLVGVGDYDLGYLVRGAYGTPIGAHASGTKFARLDDGIYKYAYPRGWLGKTVYIKLLSFNIYGQARQAADDVAAIPYTLAAVALDTVTGLALEAPFDTTECRIKWDAVEGVWAYTVEVWTASTLRRSITTSDTRYTYSAEDARSDGGLSRTLTFRVRAEGLVGQSPAWASLVAVNNQMGAPVNAHTEAGFGSAVVAADNPTASDYAGTLIWMGDASGFTRDPAHLIYDGPNTGTTLKIDAGVTKWFAIAHYDAFGQDSLTYSGYISVTALDLGGVPTSATLPGTTYLGDDVVLYPTDGSLYVWDAAASPSPTYERALPKVVADQITSIDMKAISLVVGDILAGELVMDAYGHVRGGQTDYNTGTGYFLGYSGGAYKFSLGNSSGSRMLWTGTALDISGTFRSVNVSNDYIQISSNTLEFYKAGVQTGVIYPFTGGALFDLDYIESNISLNSDYAKWSLHSVTYSDFAGHFYGGIGHGVVAECKSTGKGPILLKPSSSSSAPTHTADLGTLWVTSSGVLYINTSGGTTWQKVGAQ